MVHSHVIALDHIQSQWDHLHAFIRRVLAFDTIGQDYVAEVVVAFELALFVSETVSKGRRGAASTAASVTVHLLPSCLRRPSPLQTYHDDPSIIQHNLHELCNVSVHSRQDASITLQRL